MREDDSFCRCRIGDRYFDSSEEAEEWVAAGNIGGTYSIIYQVWCPDHLDWFDEVYDKAADEHVCAKCYQQRQVERADQYRALQQIEGERRLELAKLAAWNEARPIVAD